MINEIKLIGRKFKGLPIFDEYSSWYTVFIGICFIGAFVLAIAGIYYFQYLPAHLEEQAMLDMIDSYECADLNDWLRTNWKSAYFEEFHNKWVMNC